MAIPRTSSLLAAQEAFASVASASPNNCKYPSLDLSPTSTDNEPIISIAKNFLSSTCPKLLDVLNSHPDQTSSTDRLIKIGRNVHATLFYGQHRQDDLSPDVISASLDRLVKECSSLSDLLSSNPNNNKVPKVRYGRTNLQMPILTLGCMRFQQSWNRSGPNVKDMSQVSDECQDNLINIIRYAVHCGMNHIETALGYGSSELQIGHALKVLMEEEYGGIKREDLIIQTKGFISKNMSKADFKRSIEEQIERLGVGYVDLFSVHGVNTEDHLDWLFRNGEDKGDLIDAVRELREEGKIRWIGFSTHAPAHIIKRAIETDAFDYINLHYHWMGSYTASGDGDEMEGNLENIRLANKHDMGVFIISPYDKGGRLYAPSHQLRELTLPEMEPMDYGSYWLWYHNEHKKGDTVARADTIVCGAARPSDLDQPVLAALRILNEPAAAKADFEAVHTRITERRESVFGKDWADTWQVGLPNYSQSPGKGSQIGNMVWLYNVIQMFGMLDFAKERYATLTGNLKNWDKTKPWKENVWANMGFNWMPGCAYEPDADYTEELKDVPEKNLERVKEAMEFVSKWCVPDCNEEVPLEWQTAYDMRPWPAYPERS